MVKVSISDETGLSLNSSWAAARIWKEKLEKKFLVWPGFVPRTSCVLVGHSTTELMKLKIELVENLSLYRQRETFPLPFPPFPRREFGNFSCVVYTHTKLHVQAKKSPFWIFNGYMMDRFVSCTLENPVSKGELL